MRKRAVLPSAVALGLLSAALASRALLGLVLGLLLLAGLARTLVSLAARRLRVERTIGAAELQEDAPVRLRFTVARSTWLPVLVEIADHSGGWLPLRDRNASLDLRVARPGAYLLAPTTIRLRDPTGLFERRMVAGHTEPLLVLPVPHGGASIQMSDPGLTDDPELQGLVPYSPGAPLTRIHWPALARGAGLHVRHMATTPGGLPLVVVETAGAATRGALEWTSRTAAGHILSLARLGGCRVLLPGDSQPTTVVGVDAAWRTMHRRLATLDDLPTFATPAAVARSATVHLRAAAVPSMRVPSPLLPDGVLVAPTCPRGR